MVIEITPENIIKLAGNLAQGVAAVVTFFWTLNRLVGKKLFYAGAKESVNKSVSVAQEQLAIAAEIRSLIADLNDHRRDEGDLFKELLEEQRLIASSNATIVMLLQTLLSIRK